MASGVTAQEVLRKARGTLARSQRSMYRLAEKGSIDEQAWELFDVAVWGRSTTFVLQHLRSCCSDFDAWYEPYREVMATDPLTRFFATLRTQVLKRIAPDLCEVSRADFGNEVKEVALGPPPVPPRSSSGFFLDDDGNAGFTANITMEDGSSGVGYIVFRDTVVVQSLEVPGMPSEHLGQPIKDASLYELARLYLEYLAKMIEDAEKRFTHRP